jgi:hypothetical protein
MTPSEAYKIVQLAEEERQRLKAVSVAESNLQFAQQAEWMYQWFPVNITIVVCMLIVTMLFVPQKSFSDAMKTFLFFVLLGIFFFASAGVNYKTIQDIGVTFSNVATIILTTYLAYREPSLEFLYVIPSMTIFYAIVQLFVSSGIQF